MATRARMNALDLPCPRVQFEADFPRRLELFAARIAAARERREGRGATGAFGGGHEFVGYRPYRAGEDLRALDWSLLARLDRPYVRVTQREAGERWLVLLDTSASMGVGPPGKLQRAAEACAAIACLAVRLSAEVRVVAVGTSGGEDRSRSVGIKKVSELAQLFDFLESQSASGTSADVALGARAPGRVDAERIFVLSDLLSSSPSDLMPLARRGRGLCLIQILAPVELDPGAVQEVGSSVEWWEPETGGRLALTLDEPLCAKYAVELERRLSIWRVACAERGVEYACSSSALPFEDVLRRALRGRSR